MLGFVLIIIGIAAGLRMAYLLDKWRYVCDHEDVTEVYRHYPEGCIEYKCNECGETIFEDL